MWRAASYNLLYVGPGCGMGSMGDRLLRAPPWCEAASITKSHRPTQPPALRLSGTENEYRPKGEDALRLGSKAGWFIHMWINVWVWVADDDDDDDDDDMTILMCAQKLTDASLIYRTGPKTKTSKMKKN